MTGPERQGAIRVLVRRVMALTPTELAELAGSLGIAGMPDTGMPDSRETALKHICLQCYNQDLIADLWDGVDSYQQHAAPRNPFDE